MLLEFGKCLLLSAWRRKKLTYGFLTLTWRDTTSPQGREDALPLARGVKLDKGFFQGGRKQADPSAVPVLVQPLGWPWCCERLWQSLCKGLCKRRGTLLTSSHTEAQVKGQQGALVPSWKQHTWGPGAPDCSCSPPSPPLCLQGRGISVDSALLCRTHPRGGLSTQISALLHQGPQQWGQGCLLCRDTGTGLALPQGSF